MKYLVVIIEYFTEWIEYTISAYHNPQDPTLRVEKHSMPLWSPKTVGV